MSNAAKITLGGREFDIPELPLGVMKKVWPITARMAKRAKEGAEGHETYSFDPSEENIEDAIQLTYLGISFGNPSFTRADLDALSVDLSEIISASIVVAIQAGGKRLGEQMEAAKKTAALPPVAPQTSTELSLTSASEQGGNGTT